MEGTVSHTTVFVQGIPATCSNDQLNETFSVIGPIKKCFAVRKKSEDDENNAKSRSVGFVTYQNVEDARKAVNSAPGSFEVDGSNLKVCFARKKKFSKSSLRKEKQNAVKESKSDFDVVDEDGKEKESPKQLSKAKHSSKSEILSKCTVAVSGLPKTYKKSSVKAIFKKKNLGSVLSISVESKNPKVYHVVMPNKQAALKAIFQLTGKVIEDCTVKAVLVVDSTSKDFRKSSKRSRLIVRNLSFNCSEDELKSAFEVYGSITDLQIPTKPNGKKLGFGFVQFTHVFEAQKAIEELNKTEICSRKVAVDWALPREKYKQMKESQEPGQQKSDDSALDNDDTEQSMSDDDVDEMTPEEDDSGMESDSEIEEDSEEESSGSEMEEEDSDDESEDESKKSHRKQKDPAKKTKQRDKDFSSDVHEGKTVFLRNLSYDTQEEDLEEEMMKFGDIKYCKVVINRDTGLSKGCAFVQYLNLEDAEKCISTLSDESTKLKLDGRELLASVAMSRPDARKKVKEERDDKNEKDDTRNLYLANEGLVRAGTRPAMGLSEIELNKRRKIDEAKRIKLKNPNIFVSKTRLCVHNIPRSFDDTKLRELFTKAVKGSKLTEVRIMRDRNKVNTGGVARSLGFGFVNFSRHEHALSALRQINNNPDVFTATKRPIVEFSLENKLALATQRQRRKRQLMKNDLQKKMKPEGEEAGGNPVSGRKNRWQRKREMKEKGEVERKKRKEDDYGGKKMEGKEGKQKYEKKKGKEMKNKTNDGGAGEAPERKPFQGSTGTTSSGKKLRMPKHTGPKIRKRNKGQVLEQLRISKKLNKKSMAPPGGARGKRNNPLSQKNDVSGSTPVKKLKSKPSKEFKEDAEFNKLVEKYRNKFQSGANKNSKPKWFDS